MDDANLHSALSLGAMQHWIQAATTHPAGLGAGLATAEANHGLDIDAVVATPAGVDPRARLAIYADGYWLRLIACLEIEFSALHRLIGPQLFGIFARAYLSRHPSRAPSLHMLGAAFPAFLRRSQRRVATGTKRSATQTFAADLARLERAIAESGRAAGCERQAASLPVDNLSVMTMLAGDVTLNLPDSTHLIALRHSAEHIRPWLRGQQPDTPIGVERDYVAVRRQQFRVSMDRLSDWQFFALRRAQRAPATLNDCARAASRRTGRPEGEILAHMALWLDTAQQSGLVVMTHSTPLPGE